MDERSEESRFIALSQKGDTVAFRRLVEQNHQAVFAVAFRVVCNEDDANDIVQETFIRAWQHLSDVDPTKKFGTWLFRIAVNLAYDRLRRAQRWNRLVSHPSNVDETAGTSERRSLENEIANRDLAETIARLSSGLSPKQRIVFVLRDLQDLSLEEIATTLDMSMASVKTNLCYARRAIRRRLGPIED